MQLNPKFISNVRDVYGEAGSLWLQDLPLRLKHLSSLWDFHHLGPAPSLSYNYVGFVKLNSTAKKAVIKIAPDGASINDERRWLNCMEGAAPKIYAFDEGLNVFLMENLEPGYSLKRYLQQGDDDSATKIICQMIYKLQSQKPIDSNFRHLSELQGALSALNGRFELHLLSKAKGLFHDLTTDRSQDVLLHGDLHHDNILLSEEGWKAIDPHGYMGDPVAEVGPMIGNFFDCLPKNESVSKAVTRRLHIMADELPFDAQRIKAWAFCWTALSAAWTVEDHGKVDDFALEVVRAVDQTKFC